MDTVQYQRQIEQLICQLEASHGLLNEIVSLNDLFIPLLRQIPQADKRMLGVLQERMNVAKIMLSMKKGGPATVVESSF